MKRQRTKARDLLKEIGYETDPLNTMTDKECENEVQEIPYNQ